MSPKESHQFLCVGLIDFDRGLNRSIIDYDKSLTPASHHDDDGLTIIIAAFTDKT
jgi:hypothetical protein